MAKHRRTSEQVDDAIVEFIGDGQASWKELIEAGFTTNTVKARVERGLLKQTKNGLYQVVAPPPPQQEQPVQRLGWGKVEFKLIHEMRNGDLLLADTTGNLWYAAPAAVGIGENNA